MKYIPSEIVAWALAHELDMDCDRLGDCVIDTNANKITFYGSSFPETKQIPENMEIILSQHGDRVTINNSPKHKTIDYFFQQKFTHYIPKSI